MHSGLRLALLKPAALPDPPLSLLLLKCILCLVCVILFKLFIAWQCSLVTSWCTLCVGGRVVHKKGKASWNTVDPDIDLTCIHTKSSYTWAL